MIHPTDRAQRRLVRKKKFEKTIKVKDRDGHIRHRLTEEELKAKEAQDALRHYSQEINL